MPNWCENKLLIKADNKDALYDFKRLEELIKETLKYNKETCETTNLLDSIISMPEVLKDTTKQSPYKLPNGETIYWYEWCTDNWGTKWDACDCIWSYRDGFKKNVKNPKMRFFFNTAWAPPIPWLEKVASIFPNLYLKLEYDEPGIGFKGIAEGVGEIIDDCKEY